MEFNCPYMNLTKQQKVLFTSKSIPSVPKVHTINRNAHKMYGTHKHTQKRTKHPFQGLTLLITKALGVGRKGSEVPKTETKKNGRGKKGWNVGL